jgi:hypothetical protein
MLEKKQPHSQKDGHLPLDKINKLIKKWSYSANGSHQYTEPHIKEQEIYVELISGHWIYEAQNYYRTLMLLIEHLKFTVTF